MTQKYSDLFAKVRGLQYSVRAQSEVIKRNRQTLARVLNTFVSKIVSANFDILPGLLFTRVKLLPAIQLKWLKIHCTRT